MKHTSEALEQFFQSNRLNEEYITQSIRADMEELFGSLGEVPEKYNSKLTHEVINTALKFAAKGMPDNALCYAFGFSPQSLVVWKRNGEQILNDIEEETVMDLSYFDKMCALLVRVMSVGRVILSYRAQDVMFAKGDLDMLRGQLGRYFPEYYKEDNKLSLEIRGSDATLSEIMDKLGNNDNLIEG